MIEAELTHEDKGALRHMPGGRQIKPVTIIRRAAGEGLVQSTVLRPSTSGDAESSDLATAEVSAPNMGALEYEALREELAKVKADLARICESVNFTEAFVSITLMNKLQTMMKEELSISTSGLRHKHRRRGGLRIVTICSLFLLACLGWELHSGVPGIIAKSTYSEVEARLSQLLIWITSHSARG